jgi:hypothetical protein
MTTIATTPGRGRLVWVTAIRVRKREPH